MICHTSIELSLLSHTHTHTHTHTHSTMGEEKKPDTTTTTTTPPPAPTPEKKDKKSIKLGFAENFALSGAAAVISKTAAAPIERVKLMVQNQGEMLKSGRLTEPYKGVVDCTVRTFRTEGEWDMAMQGEDSVVVKVFSCHIFCLNFTQAGLHLLQGGGE